jgi:hypothetical protein
MVAIASPIVATHARRELTAESTLRIAWWTWCGFLVLPFFGFIATVWHLMDSEAGVGADSGASEGWFLVSMIFLALAVPTAFFWRSHIFKGYWQGQVVSPRCYLKGMCTIWIALELGGLCSLLGCWMTGQVLPNLLPALVAFMLFTPLWPNGHAMTRPLQDEHDSGDYEEPR